MSSLKTQMDVPNVGSFHQEQTFSKISLAEMVVQLYAKQIQTFILSQTDRKVKSIRDIFFDNIRRMSMNRIKYMLRTELKQM